MGRPGEPNPSWLARIVRATSFTNRIAQLGVSNRINPPRECSSRRQTRTFPPAWRIVRTRPHRHDDAVAKRLAPESCSSVFSRRTTVQTVKNALALALERTPPRFDLSQSNPTRARLSYPSAEIWAAFQRPIAAAYDP